jgi:hypothetical protein
VGWLDFRKISFIVSSCLLGNVKIYGSEGDAKIAFHSRKAMSGLMMGDGCYILFYINGSNRGEVGYFEMRKQENGKSENNGLRYWTWTMSTEVKKYDEESIIDDFIVWLPKFQGSVAGEYSIVTKEWSPSMLEHYELSSVGIDTKPIGILPGGLFGDTLRI